MSDQINLTDPTANQILIYNELDNTFINVDPTLDLFGYTEPKYSVVNIGSEGEGILSKFNGHTLQAKSIVAGEGINISSTNTTITISNIDTDAKTLNGKSDTDFILISNKLEDVDIEPLKKRLNYHTKEEANDLFMEANASNIPDVDNEYDLGSNGRRYADIYAYTFHGTATRALVADEYPQYLAEKGQVLTWTTDGWRPRSIAGEILNTFYLSDIRDVSIDETIDNAILVYNSEDDKWVSESFGIMVADFVKKDQFETTLTDFVTTEALNARFPAELNPYLTKDQFTGTISNYSTNDEVAVILEDYVTNDTLDVTLDDYILKEGLQVLPQYGERVNRPTDGNINNEAANIHVITLESDLTLTLTAPTDGRMYPMTIIIHGANQYVLTWPDTLKWLGGEPPEYAGNDIVTVFTVDGINWVGSFTGSY